MYFVILTEFKQSVKIKDIIVKSEKIKWLDLKDLQPNGLKTPYYSNLTKESLIKNGFAFTFYVWQDKNDIFIIDGHLRKDLLIELKNDGYKIPDELNCTFLDLPDKKTAVRYLLEVFNTKKNPINEAIMIDWIEEEEVEDLSFDWLDAIKSVNEDDYSLLDEIDESITQDMANEVKKAIQIEFTPEDYERAYKLCNFARNKKIYIGELLINLLQNIKDGYGNT